MSVTVELRIRLLGAFHVRVGERTVPPEAWRSRRASALVKLLALAPGFRLPRERIADALWPDFDLDAQLNNLNVATSRARRALAAAGAPSGTFLTRDGDALVLGPAEAVRVDVVDFEREVAAGWRTLDPAIFRAALALYAGDLLPDDAYDDWADTRRTALRQQVLAVMARLARQHEERGEDGHAVDAWQRLVAFEPMDEAAHVGLIRLYERLGQRQQALAQYDQLVANLRRHLDTEPHRETIDLVRALRIAGPARSPTPMGPAEPDNGAAFPRGRLPLPLDALIGREREVAEVRALLAQSRLVTLTGPGGIGKTRLALAVAHEIEQDATNQFANGVVFVDLVPAVDRDQVVATITRAMQPDGPLGQPSLATLGGLLGSRRALLVLDNFEHVVDEATIVAELLEQARQCRVLATSRVPLHLRGEIEYPVPPLPVPDAEGVVNEAALTRSPASALFVRRARESEPKFAVDATQAAAVAGVCRLLDGLPLAIELAAARVKVLSPATMLVRLDRPLALLVGGARDLPQRQQTLRDTIAWSHDLLSPAEQRLFRRFGVFVGGWTLAAAEAVVDLDGRLGINVLDGLASLVDKNLVVRSRDADDEPRFALSETIREFATEQLALSGEEAATRDRHAEHMVALAEQTAAHLESEEQARWMRQLDREEANLRSALQRLRDRQDTERLLTALKLYEFIRGRLSDGCDDLLAAAAMPQATSYPALRIDALNGAAFLARESGDYDRAASAAAAAAEAAKLIGDTAREADALINLGYVALQRGDRRGARDLFGESLRLNRMLGNAQSIADGLSFLGLTAYYEGDLAGARRLNEESLEIWERLRDRNAIVWARTRLGSVLIQQGALSEATAEFLTALTIARELDFQWGWSWSLDGLAHIAARRGAREVAIELTAVAADLRVTSGLRLPPAEQAELAEFHEELGIGRNPAGNASVAPDRLRQRLEAAFEHAQGFFRPNRRSIRRSSPNLVAAAESHSQSSSTRTVRTDTHHDGRHPHLDHHQGTSGGRARVLISIRGKARPVHRAPRPGAARADSAGHRIPNRPQSRRADRRARA